MRRYALLFIAALLAACEPNAASSSATAPVQPSAAPLAASSVAEAPPPPASATGPRPMPELPKLSPDEKKEHVDKALKALGGAPD